MKSISIRISENLYSYQFLECCYYENKKENKYVTNVQEKIKHIFVIENNIRAPRKQLVPIIFIFVNVILLTLYLLSTGCNEK